jgi:hypothetical protein
VGQRGVAVPAVRYRGVQLVREGHRGVGDAQLLGVEVRVVGGRRRQGGRQVVRSHGLVSFVEMRRAGQWARCQAVIARQNWRTAVSP